MNAAFQKIHRELTAIRRGEKPPARVYRVTLDASGHPMRTELAPKAFQREQTALKVAAA